MPGSFHGIETASRALRAFQRQLDTIGHNVANVDTPGYTRQTVDLKTSSPLDVRQGSAIAIGTGVGIGSINRIRSQYLADQRNLGQAEMGRMQGGSEGLKSIEGAFLDTDGQGISSKLDAFFSGWSKLASNPGEAGAKKEVLYAGRQLTGQVRSVAAGIAATRTQNASEAKNTITEAQGYVSQIAELNSAIVSAQAKGETPNDLLDSRDQAVRGVAGLLGTTSIDNPDGSVSVSLDGTTLVDSAGSRPFPTSWDPTTGQLSDGTRTYAVKSGALKGLADSETEAKGFATRLDQFADALRTEVNGLHAAAPSGLPFFTNPTPPATSVTASQLTIDSTVDGNADLISTGASGNAGDGSIALGLSRLKNSTSAALGGKTLGAFHSQLVTDVGRAGETRATGIDTQGAINTQLDNRIAEISGVSVDEEMADMLKTQRSYQAAAKVLSMFDENVSTLISMLQR